MRNSKIMNEPQTQLPAVKAAEKPKALAVMAARLNLEPMKLMQVLKQTAFSKVNNDEEFAALVVICNEYQLNPLLKEIYAFPAKGGIVPMVSIDGWISLINRQPNYDGVKFIMDFDDNGKPFSCTCELYAKHRAHPIVITEYYRECYRNTDPWNQMPNRMIRHKALIQAARIAFGFSGIVDEDDAHVIAGIPPIAQSARQIRPNFGAVEVSIPTPQITETTQPALLEEGAK